MGAISQSLDNERAFSNPHQQQHIWGELHDFVGIHQIAGGGARTKKRVEEIGALLCMRAATAGYTTNADRLCRVHALVVLNNDMDERFITQEKSMNRNALGGGRYGHTVLTRAS